MTDRRTHRRTNTVQTPHDSKDRAMQSVARVKALNAFLKCYILHHVVCTCVVGCEYGDKASWCANYVRGADECFRPEVAQLCCHSCSPHIPAPPTTSNDASFVTLLFLALPHCHVHLHSLGGAHVLRQTACYRTLEKARSFLAGMCKHMVV